MLQNILEKINAWTAIPLFRCVLIIHYYLQYHRAINLEFYEFPKWISFFYPKHNIIKDDKFFDEIDKLYTTIFDWLVFWVNIVQKEVPTKQEWFRAKKNAIFDLLINYIQRWTNNLYCIPLHKFEIRKLKHILLNINKSK